MTIVLLFLKDKSPVMIACYVATSLQLIVNVHLHYDGGLLAKSFTWTQLDFSSPAFALPVGRHLQQM